MDMPKKQLYITDTILRDAHQSLAATRMKTEDMLPACELLDNIGYWSIECWGGATFDACMRFLNEDPWDRLRTLRKAMPHTKLQMLLRGQNLLGYRHYADDLVEAFVGKSIDNGIDVIRVFDALNDPRNLEVSIKAIRKNGAICEAAISYTKSPVHSDDYFVKHAVFLEEMGADIICIKDMANLLLPFETYELVRKLKEKIKVPIHLHTHNTTGTGTMDYLMAAMAGVDIIDCALSSMANGTSQPATETIVATFQGTERDTGLDLNIISKAAEHFKTVAQSLQEQGVLNAKSLSINPDVLRNQIPGGMFSNLLGQLKELNAENKLEEVLREVPRVREDFGYPPLVTPTSQIIGSQAVLNVLSGERYKMLSKESKMLLRGEYGKLPGKINEDVQKKALDGEKMIQCRPADLLKPEMEYQREINRSFVKSDEDVLSCAMFPQVAPNFLKRKYAGIKTKVIEVKWKQ